MKSRISGWSFASLLMAVAIALNVLGAAFGKSVHEFLDDETNCLVVRIVIGAIGMSLVALAVRIRIKSGRGSTFLVSDRFAAIAFLGVAATIFVIGMSYSLCGLSAWRRFDTMEPSKDRIRRGCMSVRRI